MESRQDFTLAAENIDTDGLKYERAAQIKIREMCVRNVTREHKTTELNWI